MKSGDEDEEKDGYLMTAFKSSWYTIMLIVFLLAGSVVFMGIEGNHEKYDQLNKLIEQERFTYQISQWIEGDKPRAIALRETIGLNESIPEGIYVEKLSRQLKENMTRLEEYVEKKCAVAKGRLVDWNNKAWGDAFMYSVSVMSTVGWGVYYPPTHLLRAVTIIYLLFGIPIFAAMVNVISGMIEKIEVSLRRASWTRKVCGAAGSVIWITGFMFVIIAVLGYAGICEALVVAGQRENANLYRDLEAAVLDYTWGFFLCVYYTIITVTSIGFGDVYIFNPSHALLHIKPFVFMILTAVLIALFARVFSKLQQRVDRDAYKRTMKVKRKIMTLGVMPIEYNVREDEVEREQDGENHEEERMVEIGKSN